MKSKLPLPFRLNKIYPLIFAVLLLTVQLQVFSQNSRNILIGTVKDNNGKPLQGVLVKIKNSTATTFTTEEGQFSIAGANKSVLLLSHPDFYDLETVFTNGKQFSVQLFGRYLPNPGGKLLSHDSLYLDENRKFVTLLHGQQPVGNVLQSIASVNTNQLITTPTSQFMQAMPGRLAGLSIMFSNGGPGLDNNGVSYNIRNATSQTILIDGVDRGYTSIDPEQIESISVLRDALATVMFGQRSANGIIAVTTKKGDRGTPRLSFTAQTGMETPTALPKPLQAWQYATLYNEAQQNESGLVPVTTPRYSQPDIDAYKNGTDPYGHPNVDWYNTLLNKKAPITRYNFNAQGSGKGFRYFVDMDYLKEDGLLKTIDSNVYNTNAQLERYSLRSNVGVDITKTTAMQLNLYGRIERYNQPGGGIGGIFSSLLNTPQNAYPVFNQDGSIGGTSSYGQNVNIYGQDVYRGYQYQDQKDLSVDLEITQKLDFILPGLYLKGKESYNSTNLFTTTRSKNFAVFQQNTITGIYSKFGTTSAQGQSSSAGTRYSVSYQEASLGYDHSFGKHAFSITALADQQSKLLYSSGYLPENYTDYAVRATYNYNEKYFVEAAGSYSGYNWFAPDQRWSPYWAAGIGWNIHNEKFIKNNIKAISNLKLRATYGLTGQANPGYFSYIQTYQTGSTNTNNSYAYWWGQGASLERGSFQGTLVNPELRSEKSKKLNLGVDLGLWNNRLSFTGEYFYNKYSDLIGNTNYTTTILGTNYPTQNILKYDFFGPNLTATWQDHVKNFNYFITANFSAVQSKVVFMDELPIAFDYQRKTGRQINIQYGYTATGLFKSYAEINDPKTAVLAASPKSSLKPGDIRYWDRNGDGVIDNYDAGIIGDGKPISYFGVTFGFSYKGFDFSALVQGVLNHPAYMSGDFMNGFGSSGNYNAYDYNLGRFTDATAATATQPRLWLGTNTNNSQTSTFWIKNNDFVRLKNVEIGYTLPAKLTTKVKIPSIRIFANGLNLFTLANIYKIRKDLDPEGIGGISPIMKVVNFGISVKL